MAAAAERAFGEDLAFDFIALLGEDLHLQRAVVEQNDVADVDVFDEILVVHVHGMLFLAPLAPDGEREFLAGLEVERGGQVAGADGRALRVHHDADRTVALFGSGADVADDAMDPVMRRVRHVEAKHVHARVDELAEHFRGIGGGTEGGDDFGFSHPSNPQPPA